MKVKTVGIMVVTMLALSLVIAAVGVVGSAVTDDSGGLVRAQLGLAEEGANGGGQGSAGNATKAAPDSGDSGAWRAFKFVCPFH